MPVHDPTRWKSSADAYRYWKELALETEKQLYEFRQAYVGLPTVRDKRHSDQLQMMLTDARYRVLSGDLKDAHMMTAFWADALQVELLSTLVLNQGKAPRYDPS